MEFPAYMAKNTNSEFLEVGSEKKRRGPKRRVNPSAARGLADNHRVFLSGFWDQLWPQLSQAQTEEDVTAAFRVIPSAAYNPMLRQSGLILEVIKEKMFPKRREAQIKFVADSLAALGAVSARRSRDICAEERDQTKRAHHIRRYEYYIECSCTFTGPSKDHACPLCGAPIMFPTGSDQEFT
jgi:hypothetical protein